MKTKNKLLKGLLIGTFLLATNFLVAQTNTSPFQTVCAGSVEPYLINPPTANSTYNWTLPTGGSISSGQGTDSITVDWGLVAGGPHTLTVIETDVNGCVGTPITVEVTITPNTTPTFTAVGPYCSGEVIPDLPTTSNNGVTGTWSPAISNTATTTYTFTPTAGLCAPTQTLTITITPNTTPTFTPVGPYCTGAIITDLPITSSNGVTGTWAPASVSNTATTTYTFTPAAGLCSPTFDLTITINPLPTTGPINHW
jgi:D-alanyl-D-alanine carboxypeptidase